MPTSAIGPDLLLAPGTRLFHIGPPKTASTALQAAAAGRREQLLAHGVLYPGTTQSHRSAIAAFLGRSIGWVGSLGTGADAIAPNVSAWHRAVAEMDAHPNHRVLFGHEYAAGANDATARRFVEHLGPRTHVVITLRDYGSMLPSIWQEHNKAGNTGTFDEWVRRVVAKPRSQSMHDRVHVRHDQGELVQRWSAIVGPENLSVVVLDPADHSHVFTAFEAMLGLPTGLLTEGEARDYANRSLTVPELEMLRRLNRVARTHGVQWSDYQRLVAGGAAKRMLAARRPAAQEAKLALPEWALDEVMADARRHVDQIAAAGVRVIGDLGSLARVPKVRRADEQVHDALDVVPLDAAVEALSGLLAASLDGTWDFSSRRTEATTSPETLVRDLTARQLVAELRARASRRLRRAARAVDVRPAVELAVREPAVRTAIVTPMPAPKSPEPARPASRVAAG